MTELTHYEIIDDIAIVTMDDGKANAFGPNMIAAVNASLDRAADDARAVLLTGRPGLFSGGFDLKVIRSGDVEAAKTMRLAGARLMMRLYGLPLPLVIAVPGHAIALGAFCLLTADYRVGTAGNFNIGLNETSIGMSLPPFGSCWHVNGSPNAISPEPPSVRPCSRQKMHRTRDFWTKLLRSKNCAKPLSPLLKDWLNWTARPMPR